MKKRAQYSDIFDIFFKQINASAVGAKSLHYSSGQHNAKVSSDAISKEYKVIDHAFDAVVVGAGKHLQVKSMQKTMILTNDVVF